MTWYGLFAPAKTPSHVINVVAKDLRAAVADPQVREQILALDANAVDSLPAEFSAFVSNEERK